ncbi:unnamed protein product [Phaeothamnion confervicola]
MVAIHDVLILIIMAIIIMSAFVLRRACKKWCPHLLVGEGDYERAIAMSAREAQHQRQQQQEQKAGIKPEAREFFSIFKLGDKCLATPMMTEACVRRQQLCSPTANLAVNENVAPSSSLVPVSLVGNEDGEGANCSICLTCFAQQDRCTRITCGHVFHEACVDVWLEAHRTCPLCTVDLDDLAIAKRLDAAERAGESPPAEVTAATVVRRPIPVLAGHIFPSPV